jgi:hypothetical protein
MKFINPASLLLAILAMAAETSAQPEPKISAISGRAATPAAEVAGRDAAPQLHCYRSVGGRCQWWCDK